MKQFIILLSALASLSVIGQETLNGKQIIKHKEVQLGIIFSTDYDFRTLKNNNGSASSDLVIRSRNSVELEKFGYTTGADLCFPITNLIGLETGVQYSNKGYQTKNQDVVYGQGDPSLPIKARFIYNFHYVDIPLKVNFTFREGRVQFFTSAGFYTNIFLNETVKSIQEYANGKSDQKTESTGYRFKRINISPMISLGINYKLNDKLMLRAEPTYRYGVVKIIDAPVTEYLWNAGLNMGLFYALK